MSNLIAHMEREFRAAGLMSGTDPQSEKLVADLRGLMQVFADQGHSGGSGTSTLQLFDRLVHFKPLTPLLGTADEWVKSPVDDTVSSNLRCSSIIRDDETGEAVDVGMKPVYIGPDGTAVTRSEDPAPAVTFPYMPGFPPVVPVNEAGESV